jgi:hypothetical protein
MHQVFDNLSLLVIVDIFPRFVSENTNFWILYWSLYEANTLLANAAQNIELSI